MHKLPYFPFGDEFDLRMGTIAFKTDDRLVETDEFYLSEIELKKQLLEADHRYYFRAGGYTGQAQWEVLKLILNDLIKFEPQYFQLETSGDDWHWINNKTNEDIKFQYGKDDSLPCQPLDWVGQQIQEDLMLLSSDGSATLIAGQLCFANGYSLDDKYDQPFLKIHAPAPALTNPTIQAAQKLMERIPPNRSIWRASWNFKISDALDQSSRHYATNKAALDRIAPTLTSKNIGPLVFIRIERQTLTRLPESNCILFGIHTYQNTLEDECRDQKRALSMLQVLRTTPRAMMDYKGITPLEDALFNYLEGYTIDAI